MFNFVTLSPTNASQEMEARREAVVARLEQLQNDCNPLVEVIDNTALVQQLRAEKSFTPQYLQEKYDIGPEVIELLYQYAKFAFECGSYGIAAEYLSHYRALRYFHKFYLLPNYSLLPLLLPQSQHTPQHFSHSTTYHSVQF
jgi:hypothetical protein